MVVRTYLGESDAAGREAHDGAGHDDACRGDAPDEVERRRGPLLLEGRALDGHERVDGHALRVHGEGRQLVQQADAVLVGLPGREGKRDERVARGSSRCLPAEMCMRARPAGKSPAPHPSPMMPPAQTEMPASRTFCSVVSRSSYRRVVVILP